jgi:molybdate transport system substrate-binding protein
MNLKILLLLIALIGMLQAKSLTIAVAANVSYAIADLTKAFNQHYPNIKVEVVMGSTGKLTAQIKHHAPYDILMAANMIYPQRLYQEGFATTRPLIYAQGALAYLSSQKRDFSKIMALLQEDSIKKIAVANPKTAPYGIATAEALKNAKIYNTIKNKFVYGESISQTVTYATKVTDIGFVAKSSLYSPQMAHFKEGENWATVDPKLYTPIDQGIVILKSGEKREEVNAFFAFIFTQEAQKIFKKFGYTTP